MIIKLKLSDMQNISEENQSMLEDLEVYIRRSEEKLCELLQDIIDAVSAVEQAKENHVALLTERNTEASNLGRLRAKYDEIKNESNV